MAELPISKTQLDKLGNRLRDADEIGPEDRDLLAAVLGAYGQALKVVKQHLGDLGFQPIGRLKTMGTIVDKLRRERSFCLKTVQDLAGARVVLAGDIRDQDGTVEAFRARCAAADQATAVIDRRADPRAGYRAVHVVVKIDGMPVEVQFRTELQNMWAQIFERLADYWGRQIRYGGDPGDGARDAENAGKRRELVATMMQASRLVAAYEEALGSDEVRAARAWLDRRHSGASVDGEDEVTEGQRAMYLAYESSSRRAEGAPRQFLARMAEAVDKEGRSV
ncbi:RelA/SpoT domain-containing protein [Actinoplanes sp. NPDC051411]|uniref:RelA/SpoT domain-containing protein n=1 Tax=Actinoplanes sp. NPDC051411 TaxID=3155522 RepID=UPI00344175FF